MVNQMNVYPISIVILSLVFLASCSDNENTQSVDNNPIIAQQFEDTIWSVTEYTSPDGEQTTLIEDTAYQFEAISSTGDLNGVANCNASSGGSYDLIDGAVVIEFGLFEESVCEGQSEPLWIAQNNVVEDQLISNDNNPKMISYSGEDLILTLSDGRFMIFSKVSQFVDL